MQDLFSEHQALLHDHRSLRLERAAVQQRSQGSDAAWQRLSDYMGRLREHGQRLREHSEVLATWFIDALRKSG